MADGLSTEAVLDLVGLLYDAALQPERWGMFLQRLADAVGGGAVHVSPRMTRAGEPGEYVYVGYDPAFMETYVQHYYQFDPFLPRLQDMPEGHCGFHSALGFDEAALTGTAYHMEWLRPQQLSPIPSLGCVLRRDEVGPLSFMGIYRPEGVPAYGRNELKLVQAIVPHLQRAMEMNDRLRVLRGQEATLAEVLDRLPTGVLLLDRQGRVVRANRRAEMIVQAADGLSIARRQVRAAHEQDQRTLRRLIAGALRSADAIDAEPGGIMALRRPSGARPLQLLVTPLGAGAGALELLSHRQGVLIFVSDPETTPLPPIAALRALYALTPTQARLGLLLSAGKSLQEAADELAVTMHTARAHLRDLFAKTDTHRQGELIRAILLAPALLGHR